MLRDFSITAIQRATTSRLFTLELAPTAELEPGIVDRIGRELLADGVTQAWRGWPGGAAIPSPPEALVVEVHLRPGVMDRVGDSTRLALAGMGINATSVRTATRFEFYPIPPHRDLSVLSRLLGNPSIEEVVIGGKRIEPPRPAPLHPQEVRHVPLRAAGEAELLDLSARGHLFLSLAEMRVIQDYFRGLEREPTDLELETLAQTWSEHCVHKTLKSAIVYRGEAMPGGNGGVGGTEARRHEGTEVEVRYENLLRDTIARATEELIGERRGPECLSVFKDNAGVIGFDEHFGIAFKVETHNHPSAIEPYGGASTGVGGVIRDVLGCGLGAQPIANTDVFCVAPPDWPIDAVPKGVIHPRTVLQGITCGVRDYGNRMGIPTVNGAVHVDPRYLGNPLVYCGCIGLIPRDRIEKQARPGDLIVLMGGRTGRDGIHGATFSSAELTDTHEDEFAHAVQIGNAIEEKKVLDVILQARVFGESWRGSPRHGPGENAGTRCLFSSITDCGAGGLSSAVGEMAAEIGAEVDLERVPLKYAGLRYDEIWISEAQERMVLAVPPENVDALLALAAGEDVEATVIGRFTNTRRIVVRHAGRSVGNLDLQFLHDGLPKITRSAEWKPAEGGPRRAARPNVERVGVTSLIEALKERLSNPTTASKHWLIRQYDHEVGGRSAVKPLNGQYDGPSDAAVIRPRLDSQCGIAIGCGLASALGDLDPYWMAVAAIDEAIRNVVCVGGDPSRTAVLDNFCWPRVDDARNLGALVRACQACYDAAKAYGVPFISGKDSLNNEFALDAGDVEAVRRAAGLVGKGWPGSDDIIRNGRIAIPFTLLISAIALVDDVRRCVTSSVKQSAAPLFLLGEATTFDSDDGSGRPVFGFATALRTHQTVARLIHEGLVRAVHDVSDGGWLVTIAEMCIAAGRGCQVHGFRKQDEGLGKRPLAAHATCLDAMPACYVVEPANDRMAEFLELAGSLPCVELATTGAAGDATDGHFVIEDREAKRPLESIPIADLSRTWKAPLDW